MSRSVAVYDLQTDSNVATPPTNAFQLSQALPHVTQPTTTQQTLIPAVLSPTDVILRAHTGSGKSFALLLALLSKPRLLFRHEGQAPRAGISAWIVVPSNELADQYMSWARNLIPPQIATTLDAVIQSAVRGEDLDTQIAKLQATPPHIVVGTPTRLLELLDKPHGESFLGVNTLRTLAMDETDALLQLPGRFPSEKQIWRHLTHRAPGLDLLDRVMRRRATHSGGEPSITIGLERSDPRRPKEPIRRTQYRGAEREKKLAKPRPRVPGTVPLQLVCTSATANSVLRHFLGARTGWLRTNIKETKTTATYLDQTGLSQGASASAALPQEISHACLVVDTPAESAPSSPGTLQLPPIRDYVAWNRNFATQKDQEPSHADADRPSVVRSDKLEDHTMDPLLLEALAFAFAADGVAHGLALIPARWSLRKTQAALEALGVPVEPVGRDQQITERPSPVLYLLQSTSARGLDLPLLTHVFLVGMQSVGDAVHYTHVAGRVSRIGSQLGSVQRPPGKVVTIVRGHQSSDPSAVSSAEQRIGTLYRRLGVKPSEFDLSLLHTPPSKA
ncbi:hypothetical protein MYAM1_002628 [Malassezia yamatoensis]|uniref:ATP-dependent RNA helicase n=1 Tax=Malassezia yamatoensis TaxID=253288 RepID=A0AAJ6CH44_9BASI|nr:hypothetical protein MYAM1_002628 [Malassezia yamatoensis]